MSRVKAAHKVERGPDDGRTLVRLGSDDARVELSRTECWKLYELLGTNAPFVRSELAAARHGGSAGVTLTTTNDRTAVLAALTGRLSDGLGQLKQALQDYPA